MEAAIQLLPVRNNIQAVINTPERFQLTPYLNTPPLLSQNVETSLSIKSERKKFIEANTIEVDINHLSSECIIPVFSKDNELTISHHHFIETVYNAVTQFFTGETIEKPEIRVSHIIKGRVPEAIHKPVNQLVDSDKTIYYERMAFCIEVPSIYQYIDGNRLNLTIGGVRSINQENLFSKKTAEKFKVFIGFKNLVCCNLCISTDGYKTEVKAMSTLDLFNAATNMFQLYNPAKHLQLMSSFQNSYLSEHQFAQLIGKSKLYQCLPNTQRKSLPELLFTDNYINSVARSYYQDENFKIEKGADAISLWKVYNLFTTANKSSYIDSLLDRSLNATQLTEGIGKALQGDSAYRWFIE